jgi:hypothetical protein
MATKHTHHTHMHTYTQTHVHYLTHTSTHTHMHTHTHTYTHTHTLLHTHMHAHTCTLTHTHTHTYTHTLSHSHSYTHSLLVICSIDGLSLLLAPLLGHSHTQLWLCTWCPSEEHQRTHPMNAHGGTEIQKSAIVRWTCLICMVCQWSPLPLKLGQ